MEFWATAGKILLAISEVLVRAVASVAFAALDNLAFLVGGLIVVAFIGFAVARAMTERRTVARAVAKQK